MKIVARHMQRQSSGHAGVASISTGGTTVTLPAITIDTRKNLLLERQKMRLAAADARDFQNIPATKIQDIDNPAKCLATVRECRKSDQIGEVELLLPDAGQRLARHIKRGIRQALALARSVTPAILATNIASLRGRRATIENCRVPLASSSGL